MLTSSHKRDGGNKAKSSRSGLIFPHQAAGQNMRPPGVSFVVVLLILSQALVSLQQSREELERILDRESDGIGRSPIIGNPTIGPILTERPGFTISNPTIGPIIGGPITERTLPPTISTPVPEDEIEPTQPPVLTTRPSPPYTAQPLASNSGNEFYLAFMENYIKPVFQSGNLILNRSEILITTTERTGALTMIDSSQGSSMINVKPGSIANRRLDDFKVQLGTDRSKGVKIKAEQLKQITVFAQNEELHSVDGFTALPCAHLPNVTSYEYFAVSVAAATVSENSADSAFLIVACSESTSVTITPTQSISHPYIPNLGVRSGTSFSVRLHERETLYIQDRADLTGSRVVSDKPISFFTGHECGNVPSDVAECDHLVEQIPPTATWGRHFLIAPTATRSTYDIIKIVASEAQTTGAVHCIFHNVDDGAVYRVSLAIPGNFMEVNIRQDMYCSVSTNKPVMVIQFTAGGDGDSNENADPFMVIVPAISQYLNLTTFSTLNDPSYSHYVNLFVPAGFDPSGVVIDSLPRERLSSPWVEIPCALISSICGYAKQVNIGNSVHSIWNSAGGPVGVTVYGFSYLKSYAYVGGMKVTVPGYDRVLPPTSTFAIQGSSVCLSCRFGEDERLRSTELPTWSKEGVLLSIETGGRFSLGLDGSLCISDIHQRDAGNYVCHVLNQGLRYSATLEVAAGIIVEESCEIPDFEGPTIGIGKDTRTYLDTSTRSFGICCRVQGPSAYGLTWKRNKVAISGRDEGYNIRDGGYLTYTGTLMDGCAKYSCEVSFEAHDASREEITEICVGDITPPTMVTITGQTAALVGTVVTVYCSADGFPEPTKMWTSGSDMGSALPSTAKDNGNGQLSVQVSPEDSSRRYCCDVSNLHGEVLSKCIAIDVLIQPEIAKASSTPFTIIGIPYGVTWPLQEPLNATVSIGSNVMVAEGYRLRIECNIIRGNPDPSIVWYFGDNIIRGSQYLVEEDGALVIDGVLRDRDEGVYTCIADTPDVGQDESSSTIIVTAPPQINTAEKVTSPGNCLDLTKSLINKQPVGVDLCVRAGPGATLTLMCNIVEGSPAPTIHWLKDGVTLNVHGTANRHKNDTLELHVPFFAYGGTKVGFEGNYTCHAFNIAGQSRMETHISLFGDIPEANFRDFELRYLDIYNQLRQAVTEQFPGVIDGVQHLNFLTTGRALPYEDYDPGYLYDDSEESVLPQTMENMFDLVDIIPDGGSIVFNPYRALRLQETYSHLVELLQAAPSQLAPEEQIKTRQYFQENIQDPGSRETLPRLSLYLLYKNTYYMIKMEVDDLIEAKRRGLLGWEFTQWYERNIHTLQAKVNDAYMKWELYADKTEVEQRLDMLNLEDRTQEINTAKVVLLATQRTSRFKDEKMYYLVKFYPDYWYKDLKNQVRESIEQMHFQLSKLKTEVEILELTSQYLEKEMREREAINALFPSLDPVYQLYCDLDIATLRLEELVKESEDMRYECLISGNPADCHLYWGIQEHIREQVLGNFTEFYWYVHSVEAALNHREFSIPAIAATISRTQSKINHINAALNIALSELSGRDGEDYSKDTREFFTDFMYRPYKLPLNYDFTLPSSLVGRLLWYINPESTRLVPKELREEYNLTISYLNSALTNVSAKLSRVNVHRKWFKPGLFGDKHLHLADPGIPVSPGELTPPKAFRDVVKNGSYQLPLYPTSLLLATDIELTVDVPFIFHTLPTLIQLSYDPHISGGFGPFSFGPLHRASAGNMKFRVGVRDNKIAITLPGTQLIGYVSDVVPRHPRHTVATGSYRSKRSIHSMARDGPTLTESDFDQWLFSKKNKDTNIQNGLFQKSPDPANQVDNDVTLTEGVWEHTEDERKMVSMFITPTASLNTAAIYYNSTL